MYINEHQYLAFYAVLKDQYFFKMEVTPVELISFALDRFLQYDIVIHE
jgi:hypothetical protein